MLDVHIDDFYKDCATILLLGFRFFPRQQTLFIEDISGPDDRDEFGLHSPRHLAAFGTAQWLKDEGYVRFSVADGYQSVDEFVLTAKAFSRLIRRQDATSRLIDHLEYTRLQSDSLQLEALISESFLQF
ncbi:MAG: hypothetical protein IBX52_11230 [Bacterioplanes sp.]|nr:hypothetical protein [Bacterioplanes sp.]